MKCFCFPENVRLTPLNSIQEISDVVREWESGQDRGNFVFTLNSNDYSHSRAAADKENISNNLNFAHSGSSIFSREDYSGLNCICLRYVDIVSNRKASNCKDLDSMIGNIYQTERVFCLVTADNHFPAHYEILKKLFSQHV